MTSTQHKPQGDGQCLHSGALVHNRWSAGHLAAVVCRTSAGLYCVQMPDAVAAAYSAEPFAATSLQQGEQLGGNL